MTLVFQARVNYEPGETDKGHYRHVDPNGNLRDGSMRIRAVEQAAKVVHIPGLIMSVIFVRQFAQIVNMDEVQHVRRTDNKRSDDSLNEHAEREAGSKSGAPDAKTR